MVVALLVLIPVVAAAAIVVTAVKSGMVPNKLSMLVVCILGVLSFTIIDTMVQTAIDVENPPPTLVGFIGDSVISISDHESAVKFSEITGAATIKAGIGGQTSSQIAARFEYDIAVHRPSHAVLEGGINDNVWTNYSVKVPVLLGNFTYMLGICQKYNIVPLVMLMTPYDSLSVANATLWNNANEELRELITHYYRAVCVDVRPNIGQAKVGGPPGNYWVWNPAYASDTIHPNFAGCDVIGTKLAASVP